MTLNKKNEIKQDDENPSIFYIQLGVKPNAHQNRIYEDFGKQLRIDTTAVPQKGKANKAIIKMLSKQLDLSKSAIRIIRGHTSETKIVEIIIPDSNPAKIRKRLLD